MSRYSRVAWQEAMFLLPQHFQQSERAHEATLNLRLHALHRNGFGVLNAQWDEDLLANGKAQLVRCQAIFQDGLAVDISTVDPAPPPVPLNLDPTKRSTSLYLTVPMAQEHLPQFTKEANRGEIRYVQDYHDAGDTFTPAHTQRIEIAHKNLKIVVADAPPPMLETLKLAEVQRSAQGSIELRPTFIPATPLVQSSPPLLKLSRELLGTITTRARSLAEARLGREPPVDMVVDDQLSFWFLMALNTHGAALKQLYGASDTHPITLYTEFLRLCGALVTFDSKNNTALDLPSYNHMDLEGCFNLVSKRLSDLLMRMFRPLHEVIPLERRTEFSERIWTGQISDQQLLMRGRLILAAIGLPPREAANFPSACKIAEYDRILPAMRKFVTEVTITPLAAAPVRTNRKENVCYFELQKDSRGFEHIAKTGQISVGLPKSVPVDELELLGVYPRDSDERR